MEKLREFSVGEVKMSNGERRKAISVQVFLYSPYETISDEKMKELFDKMLSGLEIGAWRVKPQICKDKEQEQKYIRARFFLGKPEEFKEIDENTIK